MTATLIYTIILASIYCARKLVNVTTTNS